jgi:serine/threonine protein kinase/tetratricopeptide (TPR) repeat protein
MKSLLAPARRTGGIDRVDLAVQLLEDEWRQHGEVDLKRLWTEQKRSLAVEDDDSVVLLAELIKTDLRCRYARGQSPSVTGYLESFSELRGSDSRVLSLIYEQFCLGEERGDAIDVEAFCAHYPQWEDSLLSQLQYHRLFSQAAAVRPEPPTFPKPGDTFEEFQLLSLLGEGGTSRVFLARDLSLGGKQVVLKVSLDRGQEPKAQGALDHPHIVPVNSVVFDDRQLRGLSMPFRPGLPLDALIKRINPGNRPRSAMALWQTLVEGTEIRTGTPTLERSEADRLAAGGRATGPQGDGWEGFPVRGTYPQGVAWIVMTLAEALDHAHRMRTFHRDVKPGNVLLTLHHGPQLLDFNLAESPHSASQAEAAMHGGTLPYMAPEQIEAFLNPELWGKVGAKADIYSLGLVLRELLTGQQPDLPAETISPQRAMRLLLDRRPRLDVAVSRFNPAIPHALEAILAKCLTFSPDDRYPDARALADDLHRFLDHRPLVHAVNPSRRERGVNWAVRHRRTIAEAMSLILVVTLLATPVRRRLENYFIPIETSRVFQAAVKAIDSEKIPRNREFVDELIKPFDELIKTYPDSWQLKVYLSFVRDMKDPCSQEAESLFREVLKVPDAHDKLLAWGKKHSTFAEHLDRFAHGRFDHADSFFKNRPEAGLGERRPIQREHISLAKEALRIAVELEPKSESIVKRLALAEQVMGDYTTAYARITELIDSIRSAGNHRVLREGESDPELAKLIEPCYIQCQLAVEWADHLRARRFWDGANEALPRLRDAKKGAEFLVNYVNVYKPLSFKDQRATLENQLMVALSLGETDLDLGYLEEAEKSLNLVLRISRRCDNLLAADNTPISDEVRRRDKRWNDAMYRLHLKEAVGAIGGVGLMQTSEPPSNASIAPVENDLGHSPPAP